MKLRKPTTCKCRQPWHKILHRWRVLERRQSLSSQLKCLECGWKWWSTRKYVNKLQDHKEDHQNGLTDQDVLDRIKDGSLLVNIKTPMVVSHSCNKGKSVLQIIERESNGSVYRFVTVRRYGKKKKIALHRLVWMAKHLQLVPNGYDIDHKQGRSDAIHNLRLRLSSENRSDNGKSDDIPF